MVGPTAWRFPQFVQSRQTGRSVGRGRISYVWSRSAQPTGSTLSSEHLLVSTTTVQQHDSAQVKHALD